MPRAPALPGARAGRCAWLPPAVLLKGDVWVRDWGMLLFSCSGVAVPPPSRKDRRVQWGMAGEGADAGQDGRAGKLFCRGLLSSPVCC